jgi:hypothetical protein
MPSIMRSATAIITLLLLVQAARAGDHLLIPSGHPTWQSASGQDVQNLPAYRPARCRHLVPGPQPGTRLQSQPFAYGYFGAYPRPAAAFHRSDRGDWFQWTVIRAD